MEQVFNKLVRDRIPEIIEKNGETPIYRILSDDEYWRYLLKKDAEELEEVRTAESLEERKKEIIDKLEVIKAMAEFNGFSLTEIIEGAIKKNQERGGFKKRILLEKVIKK